MCRMSAPLFFNGRYTTTDERVLGVEDRGFQYGDGVYEVIKFRNRRLLLVREHLDRLAYGLAQLAIPAPLTDGAWREVLAELMRRVEAPDGTVYLQVTRGEAPRSNFPPDSASPTFLAYARPMVFPGREHRERGIKAISVQDLRWGRCDIKSVNLLGNVLARQAARQVGADEALLVRGAVVREGAHANLFAVLDGLLVTPPADEWILHGTVRGQVLELAVAADIVYEERPLELSELEQAEELFVTSTTQAVMPITAIDGRRLEPGPVGLKLAELYEQFELD